MQKDETTQIMLFHDLLYGSTRKSKNAQAILVSDYGFKHSNLPNCKPGTMHDSVLKPDQNKKLFFKQTDDSYWFPNKPIYGSKASIIKRYDKPITDNTYHRTNTINKYASEKWVPLSAYGLALTGTASEAYLSINGYEIFKETVKEGKFVANWNGNRVWKAGFKGNKVISAGVVAAEKAAFSRSLKTMKLVKAAGVMSGIGGVFISGIDAYDKGLTAEANAKFALDVIMTGVAFLPGPGWVISGIYFLSDSLISLSGNDWWHEVWENLILPLPESYHNAADSYYKARKVMFIP